MVLLYSIGSDLWFERSIVVAPLQHRKCVMHCNEVLCMYNAPKVILDYFIHFLKDNNDHGGKKWRCFLRSLKTHLSDVIEKGKEISICSVFSFMWRKRGENTKQPKMINHNSHSLHVAHMCNYISQKMHISCGETLCIDEGKPNPSLGNKNPRVQNLVTQLGPSHTFQVGQLA